VSWWIGDQFALLEACEVGARVSVMAISGDDRKNAGGTAE
jgi:hypothetical protein